mmetsp:Transcript_25241/g.29112  ORF Transcript_25241/g.29112 Transcript_25241/m.29112 type:complete len:88 (-) Transcript_25241:545-808(-)
MLPEHCETFCQKWGLRHVPINRFGKYQSKETFKASLLSLYHQITAGSIRDFEEGSIVMLVLRDSGNPGNDKVLSCSKLKTIEYKVFK